MQNRDVGSAKLRKWKLLEIVYSAIYLLFYRLPSTARCIMWFANSIKDLAFNWLGSCCDLSISDWISGINVPMSEASPPIPNPARPRAMASADDNDLDR